MSVSPAQLSVLRLIPIARRIARSGTERLAVYRLLNSRRGWDTRHTPVGDVKWALAEIAGRFGPGLPVCLVGHSLGGRAAILASCGSAVTSVVALAPWVYPSDVPEGIEGRRILIVHGTADRVADPQRAAALAAKLSARARTSFVLVRGAKHAMLARHETFSGLAAGFAVLTLIGESDGGYAHRLGSSPRVRMALEEVASDRSWIEV
jgi:dienelactone hydrolase